MFKVETAGLPIPAKDIIANAIEQSFGSGVVDMEELSKDNLRHKVRLSSRDLEVVLVVLDGVSTDLCKDIENGLYSSDKFHSYSNDKDLVLFLNNKFNLNMDVPEEQEAEVSFSDEASGVDIEVVEQYETRLKNKDMEIENLQSRIQELLQVIEEEGYATDPEPQEPTVSQEEYEALKKENFTLRDSLLSSENETKKKKEEISDLEARIEDLRKASSDLEKSKKSLLSDYRTVNNELTELKVTYSKQSAVLRNKESELSVLRKKISTVEDLERQVSFFKEEAKRLEDKTSSLSRENANLQVDLETKAREAARLASELKESGVTSAILEQIKKELQDTVAERDSLKKQLAMENSSKEGIQKELDEKIEEVTTLQGTISDLEGRLEKNDEDLTRLNAEKIKLNGELQVLKTSTNRDSNIEEVSSELVSAKREIGELRSSVFYKISSFAMPRGSVPVFLTRKDATLRNIRFVFAGSTESRKGTYKCLLDEFRKLPQTEKILIVDVVSETSIDYVFEMNKVVTGIEWFRKGGGVQPYLSNTCLKNVRVLSPGLGYVNDSYFLTIDWESRLTELENSGYKVIIFCGDISNVVGRVLHESFADLGDSYIYVHGNAIGSRTIVTNLRGISNSGKSIVAYFDFNTKMERFYDLVNKTNECRVLSIIRNK